MVEVAGGENWSGIAPETVCNHPRYMHINANHTQISECLILKRGARLYTCRHTTRCNPPDIHANTAWRKYQPDAVVSAAVVRIVVGGALYGAPQMGEVRADLGRWAGAC
eukprot:9490002-Pyramimonas_sp.AAC.1